MTKFCKFVVVSILLILFVIPICFANPDIELSNSTEKITTDKVSVVVFPVRVIRNDPKAMNIVTTNMEQLFNPQKYNLEIFGKGQPSPAFADFTEKYLKQQQYIITKPDCLSYAKETNSDYIISIIAYPTDQKAYPNIFTVSMAYKMQADIKILDVKNEKYIYTQNFISKNFDDLRPSLLNVFNNLKGSLSLPEQLKK